MLANPHGKTSSWWIEGSHGCVSVFDPTKPTWEWLVPIWWALISCSCNHVSECLGSQAKHKDGRVRRKCLLSRYETWSQPRLRLAVAPASELSRVSPTSLLQRGQRALIFSHLSTHSLWNRWEQGNSRNSSLFAYLAKQMQQTASSPEMIRSFSVPEATTPVSPVPSLFLLFFTLNL